MHSKILYLSFEMIEFISFSLNAVFIAFYTFLDIYLKIHWSKQLKDQPVLLLSSFKDNSSVNEHKNMKLKESTYYEMIN